MIKMTYEGFTEEEVTVAARRAWSAAKPKSVRGCLTWDDLDQHQRYVWFSVAAAVMNCTMELHSNNIDRHKYCGDTYFVPACYSVGGNGDIKSNSGGGGGTGPTRHCASRKSRLRRWYDRVIMWIGEAAKAME